MWARKMAESKVILTWRSNVPLTKLEKCTKGLVFLLLFFEGLDGRVMGYGGWG